MTKPVIIQDLRLSRPGFQLGPLSFRVPAEKNLAVVGPSGSGKTTLLRCLAGLQRAAAGSITIGDQLVDDGRTNVPPDRRSVGLVFQDGALWPHMTALQHLTFAAKGLSKADALVLLDRAGLAAHAAKKPNALSGGEAQRLGLVRALAPSPAVLLLDEPLRSVDVHQRDGLLLLLRSLIDERRMTTILVTHDRDEALALATELVVLHGGQLVEQGPALDLLQQPATAFTAAFLLGAACLPTHGAGHTVTTPFGSFPRPAGEHQDLRLVLRPGDVRVQETASGNSVAARVLAVTPGPGAFQLRLALGDQIVAATAAKAFLPGTTVALTLAGPPRLLPWQRQASAVS